MGVFSGGSQRCRLPAFHPHPSPLPQGRGRIKRPCRGNQDDCKVMPSSNVVGLSSHLRIPAARPSTGSGLAVWVPGLRVVGAKAGGVGDRGRVGRWGRGEFLGEWDVQRLSGAFRPPGGHRTGRRSRSGSSSRRWAGEPGRCPGDRAPPSFRSVGRCACAET